MPSRSRAAQELLTRLIDLVTSISAFLQEFDQVVEEERLEMKKQWDSYATERLARRLAQAYANRRVAPRLAQVRLACMKLCRRQSHQMTTRIGILRRQRRLYTKAPKSYQGWPRRSMPSWRT